MATYLLVWNPKRWNWLNDDIARESVQRDGEFFIEWACQSKSVQPGDRVFLIKVGSPPKGIFASGYAASTPKMGPHYIQERADRGDQRQFIDVKLDTLLNPGEAILDRERLSHGVLGKMHWDSQSSGVRIPDEVAMALEQEWASYTKQQRRIGSAPELIVVEGLGREATVYVRGRSKKLRDLALQGANGVCVTCDVDYSKLLNGNGVRVLQVHHKKQLAASQTPRPTRVSDLAVVCANCHALIHMDPKRAVPVEQLRQMLKP
jgi:5-methylcytosine-specific restriction enzyme A